MKPHIGASDVNITQRCQWNLCVPMFVFLVSKCGLPYVRHMRPTTCPHSERHMISTWCQVGGVVLLPHYHPLLQLSFPPPTFLFPVSVPGHRR